MPWNPNVPTVTNRVQDDLDAIRENFQHLDPLAPYVQALLDSRIVEMGSNSNGTYVRWESGLQVCYVRIGGVGPINSTWGSLYVFAGGVRWTFPAAFVSIPVVVAFAGNTNGNAAIAYQEADSISSSGVVLTLARGTASSRTDFAIAAIAVGAWK